VIKMEGWQKKHWSERTAKELEQEKKYHERMERKRERKIELEEKKEELEGRKRAKKIERGVEGVGKALRKTLKVKIKSRRKEALQAAIAREKLLRALRGREERPVNILRRVEDKIPDVFTNPKKEKPTFFSKGGII